MGLMFLLLVFFPATSVYSLLKVYFIYFLPPHVNDTELYPKRL